MATIEELKAEAAAAKVRRLAAALTAEEVERARLIDEKDEDEAAERADLATRRKIVGDQRVADARKAAAGKYLVAWVDLAGLLPDADPATLPGGGCLVLRSPPTHPVNALEAFYREAEAKERGLVAIHIDLVCSCVVYPDPTGPDGLALRVFLESSLGQGTAITIGNVCTTLGGAKSKEAKRGRV